MWMHKERYSWWLCTEFDASMFKNRYISGALLNPREYANPAQSNELIKSAPARSRARSGILLCETWPVGSVIKQTASFGR
jgi:hypothetical protein